jgi:YD repeat-containing protein
MKIMEKILVCALAIFTLLTAMALAFAQQRTFYDSSGKVTGKIATDSQGSSRIYDPSGKVTGRTATDSQGTTTFYDASGHVIGKATKPK